MSSPYDQGPTDPAAPTQFVPAGQAPPTQPQPQFGQPPQFGAPGPQGQQAPQFGQPQQPQFGQPQQPQPPQFGAPGQQVPQFGQPQQFGTQPTPNYGDPNANPYAAGPNANPYQAYAGVPAQPAKQRGRGAAGFVAVLFGSVLGRVVVGLLIVGGIAAYHFATSDPAQRNSNGQVSQSGSMDATDLKVGDCFDAPNATTGISTIKAIPCTQAHDSQVYAEPAISESSYPGDSTLQTEAKNDCGSSSEQSSISSDTPSSAQIADYFPQDASTFESQRYIICAIEDDSEKMSQSYVGAASPSS